MNKTLSINPDQKDPKEHKQNSKRTKNHMRSKRSKLILFLSLSGILSLIIFFIEWIGSKESGSLALFADAGHIITDVFAHIVSLIALLLASKKPTSKFPFGFHRFEVLAALTNGLLLIGISGFIFYECYLRFSGDVSIHVESMFFYSLIGLVINLLSAGLLFTVSKESLNLKSAYLHVLSDLLGTIAVLIGSVIIHITEYSEIDSFLSIALGIFILKTSYGIVKESVKILIEADVDDFDKEHLLEHLTKIEGVVSIPIVTVRKLTSGVLSMELRIVVNERADRDQIVVQTHRLLKTEFGVPFVSVEVILLSVQSALEEIAVIETEREFGHSHHGHTHAHGHADSHGKTHSHGH
ncbi:MAG: cation diffusion facilitator family transporter [Leptospira sp.]|nr:cation diffusion facilitator family transporter [Leptospira sp.]